MQDTNTENAPMTGQESLALIESMINRAKNAFSENGHLYILWGWVIFICSVGQYTLQTWAKVQNAGMIWMLTWVAIIYQVIYISRKKKKEKVKTDTDDIVSAIWISFGVVMFVLAFVIGQQIGPDYYKLINPVFIAVYGIPTFLSGTILRFNPLRLGGIGCWILAIVTSFVPATEQVLMIAVAMIIAWILPGYLLRNRNNKKQYA
jgi:uncharacterized membrane protein